MTDNQKKFLILKKFIGYKTDPVDIETFVTDKYFLGNTYCPDGKLKVFTGWMDALWEVFPNIVTTLPFVAATGGIGIGKTTFFRIMQVYSIYKLLCIDSFPAFCGKAKTKPYNWVFCTLRLDSAKEFVNSTLEMIYNSPYFMEQRAKMGKKAWDNLFKIRDASKVGHLVSNDCLSILLSEINEANRIDAVTGDMYAWKLLDEAFSRINSRYRDILGLFPQLLLDSSTKEANSPMEQFIRESPFSNKLKVFSYSQWEVNGNKKWFMPRAIDNRTQFWIYTGSPDIAPYVIDKEEILPEDIPLHANRDAYVKVPIELFSEVGNRIEEFIRNVIGKSVNIGNNFFNIDLIKETLCLKPLLPDVLKIDESISTPLEKQFNLEKILDTIPKKFPIYIGIDLGVKKDLTGIAIAYIEKWEETIVNGDTVYNPKIKVPIVFGLDRMEGQSTSITRIFNFLVYLNTRFQVAKILTDGFGSLEMLQNLTYKNIPADTYSVEKQLEYSIFKNLMFDKLVQLPDNSLLKAELLCLRPDTKKLDNLNHPNGAPQIDKSTGRYLSATSKDLADSCCRAVLAIYQFGRDIKSGSPIISTEDADDMLHDMYEALYGRSGYRTAMMDIENMFN